MPAPDYVFKKTYKLRPLSEVRSYIAANSHLPEIPSAQAMEQTGINLSEMNMQLLKKVEELTLYLLEKDDQLENQQKKDQSLQLQLNLLKRQLNKLAVKTTAKR